MCLKTIKALVLTKHGKRGVVILGSCVIASWYIYLRMNSTETQLTNEFFHGAFADVFLLGAVMGAGFSLAISYLLRDGPLS